MVITKRHQRHLNLAKRIAYNSDFEEYRHGAVLARGKKVINSSTNKNSYKSWGQRFRHRDCGYATHHAELGCILGVDRSLTQGATVYVARIGKKGDLRLSKPCPMCESAMRHVGVKEVIYTVDEEIVGRMKL
jgi:tRNA(Arg) A34 adenosine deaminase TadA|tara:strand:+ start:525 stop:920 length:396 start_codon:yes stop_codon:yes gene_type:complete